MGQILTTALLAQRLHSAQEAWESPPDLGDEDALTLDAATDIVIEEVGRACRTFDKAAAADFLRSAASMLETLAEQVNSGEVEL